MTVTKERAEKFLKPVVDALQEHTSINFDGDIDGYHVELNMIMEEDLNEKRL